MDAEEVRCGFFGMVTARASKDRRLTRNALIVLIAVSTYANAREEGWCVLSLDRLAKHTGIGRSDVARALRLLLDLGYVERERRKHANGSNAASYYRMIYEGRSPYRKREGASGAAATTLVALPPPSPSGAAATQTKRDSTKTEPSCSSSGTSDKEPSATSALILLPGSREEDGKPKRREKREADQRIAPILEAFCREHLRTLGMPYAVAGARDAVAIKRLPPEYTVEKLTRCVTAYFADPWTRKTRATIPAMIERAAVLLTSKPGGAVSSPHQRPPTARERAYDTPWVVPAEEERLRNAPPPPPESPEERARRVEEIRRRVMAGVER